MVDSKTTDGQKAVTLVWLSCGGCDGCTMAVLGATSPRLEELLAGTHTTQPIELVHNVLQVDAGSAFIRRLEDAESGELDPFVLIVEGSIFDESLAGEGRFSGIGVRDDQPIAASEWIGRIASAAAAVVAIGSCATWGGVPAGAGNVTGAMSLADFLGEDFRSKRGLPVVNVPGCAPVGDNFIEVMTFLLLFLQGTVPLDLDELGRPAWIYRDETPIERPDLPWLAERASELVAQCNVPSRGWINRLGGCSRSGGSCIGCTMPNFVDEHLNASLPDDRAEGGGGPGAPN